MKKTFLGFLLVFSMHGMQQQASIATETEISSLPLVCEQLFEIKDTVIKNLQRQIEPYVQQKKNEGMHTTLLSRMEEGVRSVADSSQPQLDALYGHLGNYQIKIEEYNAYVRFYNEKCNFLSSQEREVYRKTLLDSTILSSLKLHDDMVTQLQKHTRIIAASKNIDPVWQIQKSIGSCGLLYGSLVGTFSFLRNLCMPRNLYTYSAATFGFLGAFTLLKNTPKSDVNNSVVKTSAFCLGGTAVAVAVMQLYDSFGATASQDQLTALNATLENKNLSLFSHFRGLDNSLTGIHMKDGIAVVDKMVQDLVVSTASQHQQTQQKIQTNIHATREIQDGQARLTSTVTTGFAQAASANSTLASEVANGFKQVGVTQQVVNQGVNELCEELASHKENQNARFDSVEKQIGKLTALSRQINQTLEELGGRFEVSAQQLNEYFTSDAKDREAFMKYLNTQFGDMKAAMVYSIMQSQEILGIVKLSAQAQGLPIAHTKNDNHRLECQKLMHGTAVVPTYNCIDKHREFKQVAKQNVQQWNLAQKIKKQTINQFSPFLFADTSKAQVQDAPKDIATSAALLIQSARRGQLARKELARLNVHKASQVKSKL